MTNNRKINMNSIEKTMECSDLTNDFCDKRDCSVKSTRNYAFTIFDFELCKKKGVLTADNVKYSAYSEEVCPETGKPHWQGIVVFHNKVTWKTVLKTWKPLHIEPCKHSFENNYNYCRKNKRPNGLPDLNQLLIEYGERPKLQEECGKKGKEWWDQQLEICKTLGADYCDSKLQLTHITALERIEDRAKRQKTLQSLDKLENEWYIGETGSGKSRRTRESYPNAFLKQCNKWWDGYNCQDEVIIEDVDPSCNKNGFGLAYYLNQWSDHYPFPAERKGGSMVIRPKKIIVTSRYMPDQLFDDISSIESINRRFKFINVISQVCNVSDESENRHMNFISGFKNPKCLDVDHKKHSI